MRSIAAAILCALFAAAPALAQGVVYTTIKNNGPDVINFKLATNCFINTPIAYLTYTELSPPYAISFATSTDTCMVRAATFNLWFMTEDQSQMLYTFNLSMWENGGPGGSGEDYSETCQETEQVYSDTRYNLTITFNGLVPTCKFDPQS